MNFTWIKNDRSIYNNVLLPIIWKTWSTIDGSMQNYNENKQPLPSTFTLPFYNTQTQKHQRLENIFSPQSHLIQNQNISTPVKLRYLEEWQDSFLIRIMLIIISDTLTVARHCTYNKEKDPDEPLNYMTSRHKGKGRWRTYPEQVWKITGRQQYVLLYHVQCTCCRQKFDSWILD